MDDLIQISDFQVRLVNGKTFSKPIEQLSWLDGQISRHGRHSIAYITFFFHKPTHKVYYLTLRANDTCGTFHPEFYHYYNQNNDKVSISFTQKVFDLNSVMYILRQTNNLDISLGQHIINPFQNMSAS